MPSAQRKKWCWFDFSILSVNEDWRKAREVWDEKLLLHFPSPAQLPASSVAVRSSIDRLLLKNWAPKAAGVKAMEMQFRLVCILFDADVERDDPTPKQKHGEARWMPWFHAERESVLTHYSQSNGKITESWFEFLLFLKDETGSLHFILGLI